MFIWLFALTHVTSVKEELGFISKTPHVLAPHSGATHATFSHELQSQLENFRYQQVVIKSLLTFQHDKLNSPQTSDTFCTFVVRDFHQWWHRHTVSHSPLVEIFCTNWMQLTGSVLASEPAPSISSECWSFKGIGQMSHSYTPETTHSRSCSRRKDDLFHYSQGLLLLLRLFTLSCRCFYLLPRCHIFITRTWRKLLNLSWET